jgi:hypothetical protein
VSEPRDGEYEILDLGKRRRADTGREPRELPPMRLGDDGVTSEQPESPVPPWRRIAGVAAIFTVGAVAGAYLWNAREDAAELAAAGAATELVAGRVEGGTFPGVSVQRFTVAMLNAGPRDVEVLSVRPEGWTLPRGDLAAGPQTTPAGEWTSIRMSTVPDCDAPTPQALEVRVRTEARESAVTVPLPPGEHLFGDVRQTLCTSDFAAYSAAVQEVRILPSSDPDVLLMELGLTPLDPALEFDVVDATASAAGFHAEATGLPVSFSSDVRSPQPLVLSWRVQNCELTSVLGDIGLMLEMTSGTGTSHVDNPMLPGQAVAALARFGVDQCSS